MRDTYRLDASDLRWDCPAETLRFSNTDEVEVLSTVLGQQRAVDAIDFAIGMRRPGYNLYALGPEGIGKHNLVRERFEQAASSDSLPSDFCYVSNFHEPRKPLAIALPRGKGTQFKEDMNRFVEDVVVGLRGTFESEEYLTRRQAIESEFEERREAAVAEVEAEAGKQEIVLLRSPIGFAFAPSRDGKVITPDEFQQLDEQAQQKARESIESLQEKLRQALHQMPIWMKEVRNRVRELNTEMAELAVAHLIDGLRERYSGEQGVLDYLDAVRQDVIENVELIIGVQNAPAGEMATAKARNDSPLLQRYRVNLIVDNSKLERAPVIHEDDPSYERLVGRIEHRAEMGTLLTDLHMIRPGALHLANGGYLILDARSLLTRPLAYEGLKRALQAQQIRIQSLAQHLGLMSTITLDPEPIPLNLKVAVVGARMIYYLLVQLDPEFSRLFKVAADFDESFDRTEGSVDLYARLVATLIRKESLRPFSADAVASVLEFAARQAEDTEKLSTAIDGLLNLLREADYWAGISALNQVGPQQVQQAIDASVTRLGRVRERIQEAIQQGTLLIDTAGEVVGQVNGLSVMQLGDLRFGRPSRITARVRLGRGNVLDIEREVEMGGALHSKGVLILSGYLGSHYASDIPLSLGATLVFEQSYSGVDGDSASSTELYALLSALSGVPISQNIAVTGSVNQRGEVQAIGGVNEKIEGFFDICATRGLTGHQGVMIPASNRRHLMLDDRVVDAVRDGKFHVYAVESIDQGIEVLTGRESGTREADGQFPKNSVNALVEARLVELAESRRKFGSTSSANQSS